LPPVFPGERRLYIIVFIIIMKSYLSIFFCFALLCRAQSQTTDSVLVAASLQSCVQYALTHQPLVQQSLLDEEIAERQIRTRLADWYPQLNFNYNVQHNFQVQTSIIGGNPVKLGVNNTSYGQFGLTQAIFNRDVLLARRTADDVRKQVKQQTASNKIDITVDVSKAFYDVLLTQQQINLDNETLTRLERSLKDAYNQYQGGIVDKIDYKRATIALNNAKAQKKQNEESLKAKYAFLKYQMGYPTASSIDLVYDSTQLERDAFTDTTQSVMYENRIEYQQLQTQKRLQASNLSYYKWGYLPSVSGFANYNLNFLNNDFAKLYSQNYPNSFAGISLAFPIFQGTKRIQQIRQASLQLKRVDYDIASLQNNISAAYTQALSNYKGSFVYYTILKDNLSIAKEVYATVQLQYKAGIKTYLDVIFAETDLRSAQVNYTNALYQVISSKLDVQKELGAIQY
jgi:outer membrane protein